MIDVLSIDVKCHSDGQVRPRNNRVLALADYSYTKSKTQNIDKDGFAIPKRLFKKKEQESCLKFNDFANVQITDSDFEEDQSSQDCASTMMNDEESPESYDNNRPQNIMSPNSLNLEPEEIEMEDVEFMPPPMMSSRHGSHSNISLRLP